MLTNQLIDPGWVLGVRLTTPVSKKTLLSRKIKQEVKSHTGMYSQWKKKKKKKKTELP